MFTFLKLIKNESKDYNLKERDLVYNTIHENYVLNSYSSIHSSRLFGLLSHVISMQIIDIKSIDNKHILNEAL